MSVSRGGDDGGTNGGASTDQQPKRLADRLALSIPEGTQAVGVSEQPPKFALSVAEAASAVSVSPRLIYRLLAEDPSLPRVYLGRRVVIPARALENWINGCARAERERERSAVRSLQRNER